MILKAADVIETLRTAFQASSYIHLSPETLEEVCRLLEGRAKRMSLQDVQDWLLTRESQRDPIFIVPKKGEPFWITDPEEVCEFHEKVLLGAYTAWTGRPM